MLIDDDKLLNIYIERYNFELEHRNTLNSKINIPITLVIVIIGVISLYVKSMGGYLVGFSDVFLALLILTILSLLLTCFFIIKSIYNYDYYLIPSSNSIDNYVSETKEYYNDRFFENLSSAQKQENIDNDIYGTLKEYYLETTDLNIKSNLRKSNNLSLVTRFLILTTIFLLLSSIPYFINQSQIDTWQKVKIMNWPEAK